MSHKYEWLFETAQAEYQQLKKDCLTWIGLVFLDYVKCVYKIELQPDECLIPTDSAFCIVPTGIGYGVGLPSLSVVDVLNAYKPALVKDVLEGRADESVVYNTIKDFFSDYLSYAKVFIASPDRFVKVKHDDLPSLDVPVDACQTLSKLKYG